MPAVTEWHIQRAFTIWFKGEKWAKGPQKGQWKVLPAKLPGVVAWHTPNNGKREEGGTLEGSWLKDIGLEAGIPDYLFLWGGLYAIEFKKPNGKPAETQLHASQKKMHPLLRAAGIVALETIDSLETARDTVRRWG